MMTELKNFPACRFLPQNLLEDEKKGGQKKPNVVEPSHEWQRVEPWQQVPGHVHVR